ncbi:hypothetical protein MMC20_003373 [Loxospora ochrophaea]|nr:hypothetical protein [Loxospora ochrophaea]
MAQGDSIMFRATRTGFLCTAKNWEDFNDSDFSDPLSTSMEISDDESDFAMTSGSDDDGDEVDGDHDQRSASPTLKGSGQEDHDADDEGGPSESEDSDSDESIEIVEADDCSSPWSSADPTSEEDNGAGDSEAETDFEDNGGASYPIPPPSDHDDGDAAYSTPDPTPSSASSAFMDGIEHTGRLDCPFCRNDRSGDEPGECPLCDGGFSF